MNEIELFVFLMQKSKTTCKEISDRFGYCIRTAHRKVAKLSLFIPLVTIQGFQGGVFILPEYKKEFLRTIEKGN